MSLRTSEGVNTMPGHIDDNVMKEGSMTGLGEYVSRRAHRGQLDPVRLVVELTRKRKNSPRSRGAFGRADVELPQGRGDLSDL